MTLRRGVKGNERDGEMVSHGVFMAFSTIEASMTLSMINVAFSHSCRSFVAITLTAANFFPAVVVIGTRRC